MPSSAADAAPDLFAAASASRLAGFAAVNSHSSKNASSCWPERFSASAMNSGIVALPPSFSSIHSFSSSKNVASPIVKRSACNVIAPRS